MWAFISVIGLIGLHVAAIGIAVVAIKQNPVAKKWLASMVVCLMAMFIVVFLNVFSIPKVTDLVSIIALIGLFVSAIAIVVIAIKQNPIAKKWLAAMGICLIMFIVGLYFFSNPITDQNKEFYTPISKIIADETNIGKQVETLLRVTSFRYDYITKTKYLELSDDDDYISGIISSEIRVPYINVKNRYLVRGILEDDYSLKITYMEERD